MADTGLCCGSLEEPKALMKMGLSVVIVGHVNFLLGALVHGVVLRHISMHKQARTVEYGVSNVVAIASGMLGVVAGVLAIVLSKNKKSKSLMWSLFILSLVAALTAAVSAIGLFTSMVRAIIQGGRSLLAHCHFPDGADDSSVTNVCPFDPTRIYSTTLILWVPLIVTCVIQLVFCTRCFAVCISLLGLSCCLTRKEPGDRGRSINAVMPIQRSVSIRYSIPPSSYNEPAPRYTEPPRTYDKPQGRNAAPLQQQHPIPTLRQYLPRPHHGLPPLESQPLRQPHRVRSDREGRVTRAGSQQRAREQRQLLQRGTLDRSSFWI